MIQIAAAVEQNGVDTLGLGALGDKLADGLGGRYVSAVLHILLRVHVPRRRSDQSGPLRVIDDLRINMLIAAKHCKTRSIGRSAQTLPDPFVDPSEPESSRSQRGT